MTGKIALFAIVGMILAMLGGERETPNQKVKKIIDGQIAAVQEETAEKTVQEEKSEIKLPFSVPDTDLLVEELAGYEGPFLEEDTDWPVSEIAALILYNSGETETLSGEVVLMRDEQSFHFVFSDLLPGQRLMVLERDAKSCVQGSFTACQCAALESTLTDFADEALTVSEIGMCTLEVMNRTEEQIERVELYYKNYDTESGLYIGGITYCIILEDLAPGETREIIPYRYVSGYSRVVKVKTS